MARTDGSSAVIRMGKAYAGPEGKRLWSFTCVLSWAYQNLASSQFGQDKATVDVLGMCFIRIPLYLVYSPYFNKGVCAGCGGIVYISAWASALLVLPDWAMREP